MQKRRGEIGVCHYKKQWPAFYFFMCMCVGVCLEVCKCLCVYYMYAGAFCVYARGNRKLINLRCCSSEATSHWTWSLLIRLDWLGSKLQGSSCLCLPRLLSTGTHLHPCFPGLRCTCALLWQACSHLEPSPHQTTHTVSLSVISMKFPGMFTSSVFSLWATKWLTMFWGFFISVSLRHVHILSFDHSPMAPPTIALLCLPSLLPSPSFFPNSSLSYFSGTQLC